MDANRINGLTWKTYAGQTVNTMSSANVGDLNAWNMQMVTRS